MVDTLHKLGISNSYYYPYFGGIKNPFFALWHYTRELMIQQFRTNRTNLPTN